MHVYLEVKKKRYIISYSKDKKGQSLWCYQFEVKAKEKYFMNSRGIYFSCGSLVPPADPQKKCFTLKRVHVLSF